MPKIAALREIDGNIWVCVGTLGDFPNDITLWTLEEQTDNYNKGYSAGIEHARSAYNNAIYAADKVLDDSL